MKLVLIIKDKCQPSGIVDSIKMVKVLFFHGGSVWYRHRVLRCNDRRMVTVYLLIVVAMVLVVAWFMTTKACSSLVFLASCSIESHTFETM